MPNELLKTHQATFSNNSTQSDHNMILLRTIRKQVKPQKCKFNDPFIFPDNLLNTSFKTQLDDKIDQQFDKLPNNPTIDDYYGIADEIKEITNKLSLA